MKELTDEDLRNINKTGLEARKASVDFKPAFRAKSGLSEQIIKDISKEKDEPEWMLDFRLHSLEKFLEKPLPAWGPDLSDIHFDDISYYVKPLEEQTRSWDEVPEKIKKTYERLGVPRVEAEALAGVSNQWDSEVVYHELLEELQSLGVIFLDTGSALKEYPELFKEYFGTVIPPGDNKFAALNSAFWSGGSFVYVPPGAKVDKQLQTYFRINSKSMLQAERTLIIADEGSSVSYIEGCTSSQYQSEDSLHAAVVELIARPGAEITYYTAQNWDTESVWNLVTKRARVESDATVRWIQGELGSRINMKYPSVYLTGERAHGEILSVAFAGQGQNQDTGGKAVHLADNTTSQIISKSISAEGGVASYRGILEVADGVKNAKSRVVCDALLLDDKSISNTWPTIRVGDPSADIGHEATVSKVGDEQLFYLRSHGLSEEEAQSIIINGFVEQVVKEMPLEYAVEINRLIELQMEGSIG